MDIKPRLIQSVQRAIDILECFNHERTELSLSEISEALGLNQSTVHGILLTLQVNSYIEKMPEKFKYKLGSKLIEKSRLVLGSLDLREIVRPYLDLLTNEFEETSYLCLYKHHTLYVIDKVESMLSTFYMTAEIGLKIPFHSSASGKLILAYLDQKNLNDILAHSGLEKYTDHTLTDIESLKQSLITIREQGYAFENEETELGLYTMAAPIFNHKPEIIATIGILGPSIRIKGKKDDMVQKLLASSKKISKAMGYRG